MVRTPTHLLIHTVKIMRPTQSRDAGGSPKLTYAAHLTNVKARVQPQSGSEVVIGGGQRSRLDATIFVKGDVDVLAKDQVVYDGKTYKILGPPKDMQASGVLLRLDCQEMTP